MTLTTLRSPWLRSCNILSSCSLWKKQKQFYLTLTLFPRSDRVLVIALHCTDLVHLIVRKPIESLVVHTHIFCVLFPVESGADLRTEAETISKPL